MKKNVLILIFVLLSIYIGFNDVHFILTDANLMFQVITTFLGLALATYTFIFAPLSRLQSILKEEQKDKIIYLLKKLEENLKMILLFGLIIIICNFFLNYNIPFIKNPENIDFGLFNITSVKQTIFNTLICFCSISVITTFYDIMKTSFIVLRGSIENGINI